MLWILITTWTVRSPTENEVYLSPGRKAMRAAMQLLRCQMGEKHPKCNLLTLLPLCSDPPPYPCLIKQVHVFSTLDLPWNLVTHLLNVRWLLTALRKQPKLLIKALKSDLTQPPSQSHLPPSPTCPLGWGRLGFLPIPWFASIPMNWNDLPSVLHLAGLFPCFR